MRIYKEQAKDRHTTHWDMDYLSRKEVEKLYTNAAQAGKARQTRRRYLAITAVICLLILCAAVLFLLLR
jgi:type VI protein secretion system component VasF